MFRCYKMLPMCMLFTVLAGSVLADTALERLQQGLSISKSQARAIKPSLLLQKALKIQADDIKPPKLTGLPGFAVKTLSMTPGTVNSHRSTAQHLSHPVFLIGDDALSIRWLKANKTQLNKLHALGLLVNMTNSNVLHRIQTLAPNLKLLPISADGIHQFLDIDHYPVLISNQVIEQ